MAIGSPRPARERGSRSRPAQVLEARGQAVLPGLWEMHAHFTQVEWGPIYLAAGATTARDSPTSSSSSPPLATPSPRAEASAPVCSRPGSSTETGRSPSASTSPRRPIRRWHWSGAYADAGFSQIKLYSSLKPELVADIAREAHRRGLSVTGHIPMGMKPRQAIESGMDQINHITSILDDLMANEPDAAQQRVAASDKGARAREIDPGSGRAKSSSDFSRSTGR